ncbi:hypothetical protein B0A50_06260 [Salinomyces thailandicus]|uniref:Spermine/spermidine synthase n=1 Tax=Salinomyces thailandicus TaxID=706561 RepID=A0A4U0TTQ5_9PEZI|nr:hypothetical protein B0A50_06260 [Salinomyces thailandica]
MPKGRQTVRLPASQRKHDDPTAKPASIQAALSNNPFTPTNIRRAVVLAPAILTLAALYSPISQQTLAPVYGGIPSSINHKEAVLATFLIGYLWRALLQKVHTWSILPYLALWICWMPALQMWLFRYSESLGPVFGPILTGLLSCHLVIMPTGYAVAQALEDLDLQGQMGDVGGVAIPALLLDLYLYAMGSTMASSVLPRLSTMSEHFTPVKLQLMIGAAYTFLSPSKPYWMFSLAFPAVFHAMLANPHFDGGRNFDLVNRNLAPHNWTILDRSWSTTGYLSVLENTDHAYRVLRCDHSLLGGEWLLTPSRRSEGWLVNEPIYSVFEMLEAVRLIETDPPIRDSSAQALVIGLGIGIAPKALLAHGINTTILELDPAVHTYAQTYFDLPATPTILQDAVTWVAAAASDAQNATASHQKYDYILHDVFTGGAEPLTLFTADFLANLKSLLTSNGVIALNYAGDLSLPLTKHVLNTIHHTFDGQCKMYRDSAPTAAASPSSSTTPEGEDKETEDFLNLLVFCRNKPGSGPITFRQPTSKDFLGSKSRAHYLLPKPEWEIAFPGLTKEAEAEGQGGAREEKVLRSGEEGKWRREQEESAIRHWRIMRTVLPAVVWEAW